MWWAHRKRWGIQRKQFPGDFLASVYDGRLAKEIGQMASLDFRFLILEGFGEWTDEGDLIDRRKFTRSQMYGLIATFSTEHDVTVLRVRNMAETAAAVRALEAWSKKTKHVSMSRRPKPKGAWGTPDNRDWALHLLQSFTGIGPIQAAAIFDHFEGVPLSWTVSVVEVMEVDGIGKKRAEQMWGAIDG